MRPPQIVVGIGDRTGREPVLRWAVAEAGRRDWPLRILHAARPDPCLSPDRPECWALHHAARVVAAAAAEARVLTPGIRVTTEPVAGCPSAALVAAAGPHDVLVVGAPDGPGRTGESTCRLARSSVAVVRGANHPDAGPVAVGYDGSPAAETALLTAFESAAARACAVTVVRAVPFDGDRPADVRTEVAVRAALTAETGRVVAPLTDKYPEVRVDILVVAGDPAAHLAAASRGARLVVVGARPSDGPTGRPLGPVGLHLLHHSSCPVLFARACETRETSCPPPTPLTPTAPAGRSSPRSATPTATTTASARRSCNTWPGAGST